MSGLAQSSTTGALRCRATHATMPRSLVRSGGGRRRTTLRPRLPKEAAPVRSVGEVILGRPPCGLTSKPPSLTELANRAPGTNSLSTLINLSSMNLGFIQIILHMSRRLNGTWAGDQCEMASGHMR